MEVVILTTTSKKDRVFSQSIGCRVGPSMAREWLVDSLVVQLGPKQFFEWVQPSKILEEVQY